MRALDEKSRDLDPDSAGEQDNDRDAQPLQRARTVKRQQIYRSAKDGTESDTSETYDSGVVGTLVKPVGDMPAGKLVKVLEQRDNLLRVSGTYGGEQIETTVDNFHEEPHLVNDSKTGKPSSQVEYTDMNGALWGRDGPLEEDVNQGNIGDCYLMAAMASVTQKHPDIIRKAFGGGDGQANPAGQYHVTLYARTSDGMVPTTIAVDSQMPSKDGKNPEYANAGHPQAGRALWPMLLEKAYAQFMGGYDEAGDGGYVRDPLLAITGQQADENSPDEDDILSQLRRYQADGTIVCCSTGSGGHSLTTKNVRTQTSGSHMQAKVTTDGQTIEPGSLTLWDEDVDMTIARGLMYDDGDGHMEGQLVDSGTIDYDAGVADLQLVSDDMGLDKIAAKFRYGENLSKDLVLMRDHEYTFDRVEGDKIVLRNPWGYKHPVPLTAAQFCEYFDMVTDVKPGKAPTPPGK